MTKKALRKKFNELKRQNNQEMDKRLEKAINSGCIDIKGYGDNYRLPKILMSAICKEMADQWRPLYSEAKAEVKNIGCFL